jgi:phospholipid-translocating ATPase
MAIQPYQEDNEASAHPLDTAPAKRLRWATQRATGAKGIKKRQSIFRRLSGRRDPEGDFGKRESTGTDLASTIEPETAPSDAPSTSGRRIFFNQPLPDDARDEDGLPITQFVRNKVRTAKYTPISFVPKNIWFQFHNIANIYFLFIIILSVSPRSLRPFPSPVALLMLWYRSSPSSAPATLDSVRCR